MATQKFLFQSTEKKEDPVRENISPTVLENQKAYGTILLFAEMLCINNVPQFLNHDWLHGETEFLIDWDNGCCSIAMLSMLCSKRNKYFKKFAIASSSELHRISEKRWWLSLEIFYLAEVQGTHVWTKSVEYS